MKEFFDRTETRTNSPNAFRILQVGEFVQKCSLNPLPGGHPHRDPHPLERLHLLHDQLLHRVRRGQVGLQQLNDLRERLAGDAIHLQVL